MDPWPHCRAPFSIAGANAIRMQTLFVVLLLAAIIPGCSSANASPFRGPSQSTGTFDDWVAAVCLVRPHLYSPGPVPTWMCTDPSARPFTTMFFILKYSNEAEMRAHPEQWGRRYSYASCTAGDDSVTVFVSDVAGIGSRTAAANQANRAVAPLSRFGCVIQQADPYAAAPPSSTPPPAVQPPIAVVVPGMKFGVVENQPCNNWMRYTYGLTSAKQTMACVSFDGGRTGVWSAASTVMGVQQTGAPCGTIAAIAQAPDGRPMRCNGERWNALDGLFA